MDGLEAVEIRSSDVMKDNDSLRLDSEFFKKDFYLVQDAIQKHSHEKLGELTTWITQGPNPIFIEDGIPSLNGRNIAGGRVEFDNSNHISEEEYQSLARFQVKENDVLLTLKGKGSVGKIGFVFDAKQGIFSRDIGLIRVNPNKIESAYLHVFLNSKYGKLLIERGETGGTGQTTLTTSYLKKLQIPRLTIETKIGEMLHLCERLYASSQTIYEEAENVLLEHLGLKDWQPSEAGVSVKSFADSFGTSARLDAEHYQPKYEALEQKLGEFESLKLGGLVRYPVSSGSTPKAGGDAYTDEEQGIPFIRAVDLKNSRVSTDNFIYVKPEIHNSILKKTRLKKNDVLFSIAGTVGRCALFKHDFAANINQAVSILRFDEQQLKRLYVTTFFNSEIGKLYVSKYSRQGLQTNLNLEEVGGLSVPLLDMDIQEQIIQKVEASFHSEALSKNLHEIAKRGVELAIEESEAAALAWIETQLTELGVDLPTVE